jgi:hypothetical protein
MGAGFLGVLWFPLPIFIPNCMKTSAVISVIAPDQIVNAILKNLNF